MYQQITIVGYLGRDPELRYTPSGAPVCNFSVATSRRWTDRSGQSQEKTVWFRVVAWNKLGEICNQYLAKGRLVLVVGEVEEPRAYKRRDGSLGASLDVTARSVKFLSRSDAGDGGNGSRSQKEETGDVEKDERLAGTDPIDLYDEEEIPF